MRVRGAEAIQTDAAAPAEKKALAAAAARDSITKSVVVRVGVRQTTNKSVHSTSESQRIHNQRR